jgi:hypothetical protein
MDIHSKKDKSGTLQRFARLAEPDFAIHGADKALKSVFFGPPCRPDQHGG